MGLLTNRPGRREAGPWNPMTRVLRLGTSSLAQKLGCMWAYATHPEPAEGAAHSKHASTSGSLGVSTLPSSGPPGLQPHPSRTLWPCPASLWTLSFDFSSEVCGLGNAGPQASWVPAGGACSRGGVLLPRAIPLSPPLCASVGTDEPLAIPLQVGSLLS